MHPTIAVLLLAFVLLAVKADNKCPAEFLRLSSDHSYCQPPNPQCQLLDSGVSEEDKKMIIDTHNQLRNKVAVGDDNTNGLPTASNMLQMVWDDTLAAIAQVYAYQCEFEHDCNECRSTADFPVGQNLGQAYSDCYTDNCAGSKDADSKKRDWKGTIEGFYNERKYFDAGIIQSYQFSEDNGHFSQLAWAKTWKVGCGFTAYLSGSKSWQQLYVCNYAIAGNYANKPVYQAGDPCSACPKNSCCGDSCGGGDSYSGLCKLNDPNKAPQWPNNEDSGKQIIYDCQFGDSGKCNFNIEGNTNWLIYSRVFGSTAMIVLNGGESTKMNFLDAIKPSDKFCLVFIQRKGPNVAGEEEDGELLASMIMDNADPWVVNIGMTSSDFYPYSLDMYKADTTFSLSYSVPDGAPPQYVEVKRIYAYLGGC